MASITEENYLKAIFQIHQTKIEDNGVGTNELAYYLGLKPATVNDMLKKIKEKKWVTYEKYGKIFLTREGKKIAIEMIRKHRIWETFLYEKLGFSWDEVHDVAEQLEHIQSEKLIDKIDEFLCHPKYDPHGEIIPTKEGDFKMVKNKTLNEMAVGTSCKMVSVKDDSADFLKYVDSVGLSINCKIKVRSRQSFDDSIEIEANKKISTVSYRFSQNIYVI